MSDFAHIEEDIERLREAIELRDREFMGHVANTLEALLRVARAADMDISDAEMMCGKFNRKIDCSAYLERNLTCSNCPVDWFVSIKEALDQLQEREA